MGAQVGAQHQKSITYASDPRHQNEERKGKILRQAEQRRINPNRRYDGGEDGEPEGAHLPRRVQQAGREYKARAERKPFPERPLLDRKSTRLNSSHIPLSRM